MAKEGIIFKLNLIEQISWLWHMHINAQENVHQPKKGATVLNLPTTSPHKLAHCKPCFVIQLN
jgi:hypothetical protein